MYKPDHFTASELFPDAVIKKYPPRLYWGFYDQRLLEFIDWLRKELDRPIRVNINAAGVKNFQNRGFRPNTYTSKLYCSQHCFGRAIDFDVDGMSAEDVRQWLRDNKDRLPLPIWVEDGVNWVHIDIRQSDEGMLYFFKI